MSLRETLFILLLSVALGLVVAGVALWSVAAALVVSGLGVAGLAVLMLTEVGG
jgi:hypothetical protein